MLPVSSPNTSSQTLHRLQARQVRSSPLPGKPQLTRARRFCTTECSTKEWPDHKSFCRAFSALRSRPHATLPPPYEGDFRARRETHRAQWLLEDELLTTALGRPATALEGKLLYREPRCGVCWDREADVEERGEGGWRVCGGCRVMAYCGEEHEREGLKGHSEVQGEDGRTQVCFRCACGGWSADHVRRLSARPSSSLTRSTSSSFAMQIGRAHV